MKLHQLVLAGVLASAVAAFGQSAPAQTPPPGAQTESGAGAQQNTMGPGMAHPPRRGMEGSSEERQMQAQHMQQMRQQVDKMRSVLDQMKTNVAGMSGKDKAAMQANVQLWQMMVDHMDQMVQHMSSMQGQGMMGMRHNMMHGNMKGMKPGDSMQGAGEAAPASPQPNNPSTPPQ